MPVIASQEVSALVNREHPILGRIPSDIILSDSDP